MKKSSLRKKSMTRRKSLRKKLKDGMDYPKKSEKISELEKKSKEDFDKLIEEINKYKVNSDPEPTKTIHMLLSKIKRCS